MREQPQRKRFPSNKPGFKIPVRCDGGHEHFERVQQVASDQMVTCSVCGKDVLVGERQRAYARELIKGLGELVP